MDYVIPCLVLIIGFGALIKGADFFVEGASSIAKRLRIPDIVVGLTVVAMGTSMPELAVSMSAAFQGSNSIAIGNVVGSNIINVLVILGMSAVILPLHVDKAMFKRDIPVLGLTAVLLPALMLISGRNEAGLFELNWVCGLVMTVIFVSYIFLTVRSALVYRRNHPEAQTDENGEEIKVLPWWKTILFVIGGAALIIAGGNMSVNAATDIATLLGISEDVIALTVVALGTSLPELVTSVVAARKGNSDIALGNVVGSNIFNVLFILGSTLLVSPMTATMANLTDQLVCLGVSALLALTAWTGKRLSRIEGALYLVCYAGYMTFLFLR